MPENASATRKIDTEAALKKVRYCSEPDWVERQGYPADLERKDGEPITRLLIDEQHDFESQCTYLRVVQRLENMDAVQNLSQWQLSFDPSSQEIQLHHLKVIREETELEYATDGAGHLLQREESLESFILHGKVTLLILLEDIRPGDRLDCSYTLHHRPHLLSQHYTTFCQPPRDLQTGQFHYSIRYADNAPLNWQTSPKDWQPTRQLSEGFTRLAWEMSTLERIEPEPNAPGDRLPERYIQLSSISRWEDISQAASERWPQSEASAEFQAEVKRLAATSTALSEQIEATIRFIQDDFRYLSVNLEVGGQIPAAPNEVLRRRYGDCKDLSLLLSYLLNALGVQARPVLVHQAMGKHLPDLLPSPALFDHVVVEFEHANKSHWVDATMPLQGGGMDGRQIHRFHYGLPLSTEGRGLSAQPTLDTESSRLELFDTLMFDTAGNPILLRVQTIATGSYADALRIQQANEGREGFATAMKQRQTERFEIVKSLEPLDYDDERATNTWRMVEMYEIPGITLSNSREVTFNLPPSIILSAIPLPGAGERRLPFAIPENLNLLHKTEIRSKGSTRQPAIKRKHRHPGIEFTVEASFLSNSRIYSTSLNTRVDSVPADQVAALREVLTRVTSRYSFTVELPANVVRTHREIDFFKLPKLKVKRAVQFATSPTTDTPVILTGQKIRSHPKRIASRSSKKQRSVSTKQVKESEKPTSMLMPIAYTLTFIGAFALALYIFTR